MAVSVRVYVFKDVAREGGEEREGSRSMWRVRIISLI